MYRSFFPRDMLAEMDRLQRDMQQAFDLSPTIRGYGSNGFPALNVGATPQALEIFAFAPGVDPATLEINLERGLMTIAGERKSLLPDAQAKAAVHINEALRGAVSPRPHSAGRCRSRGRRGPAARRCTAHHGPPPGLGTAAAHRCPVKQGGEHHEQ